IDVSTLREPYRIEGKKTLGLELAEQFGWTLPDAIVYPTGGGTGLIGMWKAFQELRDSGWIRGPLPRMYTVQATGCAPVVEAFESGAERATACPDPKTVAAGLRVPSPLGDRLMLRALRDSKGGAVAVSDEALLAAAKELQTSEGIDASPEGGAALAGAVELKRRGQLSGTERVVLFNTGAGWLYRAKAIYISRLRPMRIAILDPAAGISGDMTLGALLSLGVPVSWLEELPARLGIGDISVSVRDVRRAGITCRQVQFDIPEQPHGRHVGDL